MYRHTKLRLTALAVLVLLMSGCATPRHTDLLVFATNTELGVSAKGDSTSTAGVSIGYHRQEVVLMPLFVNANESKVTLKPPVIPIEDAKYAGTDNGVQKDTYSVLASFGANSSAATNNAGVSIAQYFATGLAARTLALAGGALVTTSEKGAATSITPAAISAEKATQLGVAGKQRQSQIDQITAKVADPTSGTIDQKALKKAFTGIDPQPADLAKITSVDLLKTELNQPQYDWQLTQILNNLSSP